MGAPPEKIRYMVALTIAYCQVDAYPFPIADVLKEYADERAV
jgi:hypothetical protein